MQQRLNFFTASQEAYNAVKNLEIYVQQCGLERRHIHLIKLRASILNHCAYCIDMHVKESRHDGLSEQWINLISAWEESPIYDEKERALLAWVDAVTLVADSHVPANVYEGLKAHFTEEEMVKITVAIGVINVWNRLCVGFRALHPVDQPAKAA
ncbi:carboxymuconolactone decarboxylase family protein [Rhizobium sp. LCM 4573]|uniref:carboxymuconolactone decarboxylase family protein n=1 Tax=Rhizobium sp. LCM 4573 TaxID=1848291 RepID=UPI0008D90C2C|nr:carboxymuconolactone decarboxylase family protein [Rhizobium sp. LCM 4573]OHV83594.1 alkylhydroperoxidase [Rhizobium sp. LCM 4573]